MIIKNTVPLSIDHLVSYHADDCSLIFLAKSSGKTMIFTLDSEILATISSFPIETEINEYYEPCIDDNCLYFPTKFGQILAIDKFSGQILTTMNPSMPIVSDLKQDDENIYCIFGVPISKKWKLVTDNYCVCVYDKETGKKKIQTSYFPGKPISINVSKFHFWVTTNTYIYKYKKKGEMKKRADLSVSTEFRPILTEDHIIFCYANGVVRILNTSNLSFYDIIRAKKCTSHPILLKEGVVAWFSENGVCEVEYKKQRFRELKTSKKMTSDPIAFKQEILGCDINGSLVSHQLESNRILSAKLSNEVLYQPVSIGNQVFVASKTQLHQIEMNL